MNSHEAAPARYVAQNPFFRIIVGRDYSIARAAGLLAGWYVVLFAACLADGTLRLEEHVGLLQDGVMLSLFPCLLAAIGATRHLLRRLDRLITLLPCRTGASDVDHLSRLRKTIALETPGAIKAHRAVLVMLL